MSKTWTIELSSGSSSIGDLQACISQLMEEAQSDPSLLPDQVNRDLVASATTSVREDKSGLDPFLTGVLVTIASEVSIEGARAIWRHWLLPQIRKRLGVDAVGDERAELSDDEDDGENGSTQE